MWRQNLMAVGVLIVAFAMVRLAVQPTTGVREAARAPVTEVSVGAVAAEVDREFEACWERQGLSAAGPADRLLVARRLSLAMMGTLPSLEDQRQLLAFQSDDAALAWWCEVVLADRRFADYQAERFARALVGVEEGPFLIFRRRRFTRWLSDQFAQSIPYDVLVRKLITSRGLWTDNPAVNFLTVTTSDDHEGRPDPVRLAGRTTRAFLGVRLDCMQCHDDNLEGKWLQSDFHELAAFYAEVGPSQTGIQDQPREYRVRFLGETNESTVTPQVPFRESLLGTESSRRARLAAWVTHPENLPFARAWVNRTWALAFGRGLIEPIDQIPLEGPFPPGLETLARDFVNHDFDMARLWRVLIQTEVFRKESAASFEVSPTHETNFAVFPLTRLRPEQIAGSLLQASKLTTVDAQSHILVRLAQYERLNQFSQRYGDAGEDELSHAGGTVPQRLLMMNGSLIKEVTQPDLIANAASRIATLAPTRRAAIETLYRAVLTRLPTPEEWAHFDAQFSDDTTRNPEQQMEDLAWVLMNSTEFSWNH
ncbi:MAG: DUF1553 domain-containing protein [Planctomycetota bacterium]